jgi:hypothetical protein
MPRIFYYDSFAALAVEFGVEDALPGAEVELAVGNGHGSGRCFS